MGYKMYCDECGKETPTNYLAGWHNFIRGDWIVQLSVRSEDTTPRQVLCKQCLVAVIVQGLHKEEVTRGERGIPIA